MVETPVSVSVGVLYFARVRPLVVETAVVIQQPRGPKEYLVTLTYAPYPGGGPPRCSYRLLGIPRKYRCKVRSAVYDALDDRIAELTQGRGWQA